MRVSLHLVLHLVSVRMLDRFAQPGVPCLGAGDLRAAATDKQRPLLSGSVGVLRRRANR